MHRMGERPREPRSFLRELRSRMPVSPLPWHWHRRINRGTLVAILVGAAAFAVTSVLIQRSGNEEAQRAAEIQASPEVKAALSDRIH